MRTALKSIFDNEALSRSETEVDRRILIVHDIDRERNDIADSLANDYVCTTAASVQEALAHLAIDEYALVILNPQMVLFDEEYFHDYFQNLYPNIALIFLGHSRINLNTEELVHLQRPFDRTTLDQAVSRVLNFRKALIQLQACRRSNADLLNETKHLNEQLQTMKSGFVEVIAALLRAKDESAHSRFLRASTYVELLGEAYSLNDELRESLSAAVVLRELNEVSAVEFLAGCDSFRYAMEILRFEHENFDGTGTPMELEGTEIPIASRILRVAVELAGKGVDAAIEELSDQAGIELDPSVVDCLAGLMKSENQLGVMGLAAISNSETVRKSALIIQNS